MAERDRILGVGSALVDVLIHVDDEFLKKNVAGAKGGMEMVTRAEQERLIGLSPVMPELAPGGAAGNTIFTLARMGVPASMLSCVGDDAEGRFYRDAFRRFGGEPCFRMTKEAATGCCLSLVTPDSERTMRSYLGASQLLTAADVEAFDFAPFKAVYVEGYLLFLPQVTQTLMRRAHESGCKVAFDMASFEVVGIFREELRKLIPAYVDWIFANEDEAAALLGERNPEKALDMLATDCEVAVVKLGSKGSLARRGAEFARIAITPVEAVDTTAAGDTYAAGFIYGLEKGYDLARCGRIASLVSAEVVQVTGSTIPDDRWARLMDNLAKE